MLRALFSLISGEHRRPRVDEGMWALGYVLGRIAPAIIGWYLAVPASKLLLHLMGY